MENTVLCLALTIIVILYLLSLKSAECPDTFVGSGCDYRCRYYSPRGACRKYGCRCRGCDICGGFSRACDIGLPGFKINTPTGGGESVAANEGYTNDKDKINAVKAEESTPYQETIQKMALEDDIAKSHRQFVDETHHRTSTASKMTLLTHDNDINPRVGLRRTQYNAGAQPMLDTRVISSQDYTQLSDYTPFHF